MTRAPRTAVRVRRSVWSLQPDDPVIVWYRRAVAKLLPRPASDPTSWRYLAAIHGVPRGLPRPPGTAAIWDKCQHQSWFFLPWHRAYLASFEAVLVKTIADLKGPKDWALPYWDYSEDRASNPNARLMHPAFRDRRLPDGSDNALWSRRAAVTNGDFGLDDAVVSVSEALRFVNFTNSTPGLPTGFGGPDSTTNPGPGNGAVENAPHNRIHMRIGGDGGFMRDPRTAALDPIFWLHHCNIDRLWEVWRASGGGRRSPAHPRWAAGAEFRFPDAAGRIVSFRSRDVLDTTALMHGYRYDKVAPVKEPPAERLVGFAAAGPEPERATLAGANAAPIELGAGVTRTTLSLAPRPGSFGFGSAPTVSGEDRVYLNLENITGVRAAGDYDVYIDLPDDAEGRVRVGTMTTFNLEQASDPDRPHGGGGLTQVFEITEVARRLGLTGGDLPRLQISFVREDLPAAEDDAPPGLAEYVGLTSGAPAAVRVGRVSLFYGSRRSTSG